MVYINLVPKSRPEVYLLSFTETFFLFIDTILLLQRTNVSGTLIKQRGKYSFVFNLL